jgi:arylsulfatase A
MTRREFLPAALGGLVNVQARQPNVVLIMADDLGYECLRCNGATGYHTPKLDELAASGIRFTRAHSTPLCTPTRVQLMTGQYNFRNYKEFGSLPKGERTFGHLLQQAGYRTAVAGKWQLAGAIEGTKYKGIGTFPSEAGFHEHCLWQVKDRGSRYWAPIVQINDKLKRGDSGTFGPDLFTDFAEEFMERHRNKPFFLY